MDFDKLPRFKSYEAGIALKIGEWSTMFDVEDKEIERQLDLAHGWIDVNPKKAPKKNIMRYLFNWLCIAQRKGSLLKKPRTNFAETKPQEDELVTADMFAELKKSLRRTA